jgi:hypothetical protein
VTPLERDGAGGDAPLALTALEAVEVPEAGREVAAGIVGRLAQWCAMPYASDDATSASRSPASSSTRWLAITCIVPVKRVTTRSTQSTKSSRRPANAPAWSSVASGQ